MNVDVEAELITAPTGGIVAWTETIEDPREPLDRIRAVMIKHIAERFESQSSPWGVLWAPWSDATVSIRIHRGKDLVRSPFGPAGRVTDSGRAISIGFGSNPLPRFFHFGNPTNKVFGRGAGPIPGRPILPITSTGVELPNALRDQIMSAFVEEVREEVRRRGGRSEG